MARFTTAVISALSVSGVALASSIPRQLPPNTCEPGSGLIFFRCANGYVGCFAKDPCALPPLSATTTTVSSSPAVITPPATTAAPGQLPPGTCAPNSGLTFYRCANGYVGCFPRDPCALPPLTFLMTTITTTTTASTSSATAAPSTKGEAKPTFYNISPASPTKSETSFKNLLVKNIKGQDELQQAMVFSGIPKCAKKCGLNWRQAGPKERIFHVESNGSVAYRQLTGFPADRSAVSYNAVKPFEPTTTPVPSADFTFWDLDTVPETDHSNGSLDCAEEMFVKIAINQQFGLGDGQVYMEQDAKNGFYVSYSC